MSRWNAQKLFAEADSDHDGVLSPQEFFASYGTPAAELHKLARPPTLCRSSSYPGALT